MALDVSVIGGSGYAGGELVRLLLFHPEVNLKQVTSERQAGKFVRSVHPNLRKRTELKFVGVDALQPCDVVLQLDEVVYLARELCEANACLDQILTRHALLRELRNRHRLGVLERQPEITRTEAALRHGVQRRRH